MFRRLPTFLIFRRWFAVTLPPTELLPYDPHPRVNEGLKALYTSPIPPNVDGEFQMLKNHAAIISMLVKGNIKIVGKNLKFDEKFAHRFEKLSEQEYYLPIETGTIELKDNRINILAS